MEVTWARSAGFCFDVARAVKLAEAAGRPRMLGSGIHNEHIIDELERKGMKVINAPPGDSVLLRAHGVGREVYRALLPQGAKIVDATSR